MAAKVNLMENDKFALVEKIIKDVDNILSKNAELYTFEIVPVDENFRNKSPVLFHENNLGLESWCVKHVYMYCYYEIFNTYFSKPRKRGLKLSVANSERLVKLLNVTLLLNPDVSSLWNKRRELMTKSKLEQEFELCFTRLVLSRKPKCNDSFGYRRWILERILDGGQLQTNVIENLVSDELSLCNITAEKAPNNYHSWCHRMWLIKQMKRQANFNSNVLLMKEYQNSEKCSFRHISDFSSFHYRQFCIKSLLTEINDDTWPDMKSHCSVDVDKCFIRLLATNMPKEVSRTESDLFTYSDSSLVNFIFGEEQKGCICQVNINVVLSRMKLLAQELTLNSELITFYKHHETLWYHRRFIIHEMLVELYKYFGLHRQNGVINKYVCEKCNLEVSREKQAKIVKYDCASVFSCVLYKVLTSHEAHYIEISRESGDNYADRHDKYLKFVEGVKSVST